MSMSETHRRPAASSALFLLFLFLLVFRILLLLASSFSLPFPSRPGSARLCCLGCAASMGAPDTSAPAPAVPPTASSPSSMPRLLGRGLFATPFTCPPIYTPPHWCRFYCSPASERGGTTSGRQAPHQTGKKGGEGRGGERKKTPTPTTPQNKKHKPTNQ